MSLVAGQIIEDKYRIVGLLGEGGMGAVFEGENVRIKRRVAIKVLHPGAASPDVVERFQREAQAAGTIGNDHILEILDLGKLEDGANFMVMEYLDGETLSDRVARFGRLSPAQLAPLMRQVLVGLRAVHAAGIIHRDLKPDNIYILKEKAGQPDFVKLIDFGISKFSAIGGEFSQTRTGAVMGTPYYMSPEQANGSRQVDSRSDLYSVGVILFEAVTGQVPFDGQTFNELMFKIVLSEPPPPRQFVPDLDPAFESIIAKAMARDASFRFQSAEEFEHALAAWTSGGASVSLPPPEAGAPALPVAQRAPPGAGGSTGTWSSSQATEATPPKSNTGLFAVLAVFALLLLGGGGLGAYLVFGRSKPAPAAASATPAPALATAERPAAPAETAVAAAASAAVSAPVAGAPSAAPAVTGPKRVGAVGGAVGGAVKPPAGGTKPPAGGTKPPGGGEPDFGY